MNINKLGNPAFETTRCNPTGLIDIGGYGLFCAL